MASWDPRGTGESSHVRCFANGRGQERFWGTDWSVPTATSASRRYLNKTISFVKRCVALTGRLLAHKSTADSARDLDYLRRLAGDRKLNYLGVSYGTFLGQTYANMFPGRVRAMVLDGVVDPIAFTTSTEAGIANGSRTAILCSPSSCRCAIAQDRRTVRSPAMARLPRA